MVTSGGDGGSGAGSGSERNERGRHISAAPVQSTSHERELERRAAVRWQLKLSAMGKSSRDLVMVKPRIRARVSERLGFRRPVSAVAASIVTCGQKDTGKQSLCNLAKSV